MKSSFRFAVLLSLLFAVQNYFLFTKVISSTKQQFDDALLESIVRSDLFKNEVKKQTGALKIKLSAGAGKSKKKQEDTNGDDDGNADGNADAPSLATLFKNEVKTQTGALKKMLSAGAGKSTKKQEYTNGDDDGNDDGNADVPSLAKDRREKESISSDVPLQKIDTDIDSTTPSSSSSSNTIVVDNKKTDSNVDSPKKSLPKPNESKEEKNSNQTEEKNSSKEATASTSNAANGSDMNKKVDTPVQKVEKNDNTDANKKFDNPVQKEEKNGNTDANKKIDNPVKEVEKSDNADMSKKTDNPVNKEKKNENTDANKKIDNPVKKEEKNSNTTKALAPQSPLALPKDLNEVDSVKWRANVCKNDSESITKKDSICREVIVVPKKKVTFCSAATEASTTMKNYFFDIADGSVVIPKDAKFSVHQADWKRLGMIGKEGRDYLFKQSESKKWTSVLIWSHVVERFVAGYLSKVVRDCKNTNNSIKKHMTSWPLIPLGFSCEKHTDFEAFVDFMETALPKIEGYFQPQTQLCSIGKYPYTDTIQVDANLNSSLEALSSKLGVSHPKVKTYHKNITMKKMVNLFKGKTHLITKILVMFKEDCAKIPDACEIKDLMTAVMKTQVDKNVSKDVAV